MVSVIVPVYRVEEYLGRCVDSILAQTAEDLEVILVDDGSPDGCGTICDSYSRKDSRVRVIHKENGGLSDARNAGLAVAAGEYIMFVDGDDYIHPRMTECLLHGIREMQADIAFCGIDFFTDQVDTQVPSLTFREYSTWAEMAQTPEFSVCNRLFRAERFRDIRFPVGRLFEDQFVIFKLFTDAKVVCTEDKMYYYFQRNDSLSKSKVYAETYDLLEASLEMLKDIPQGAGACRRSFSRMAVKRIGLMLGNAFYRDGQYQNCQLSTITQMVCENRKLLTQDAGFWDRWMLRQVAKGEGIVFRFLVKSYLTPGKAVKNYFKRVRQLP